VTEELTPAHVVLLGSLADEDRPLRDLLADDVVRALLDLVRSGYVEAYEPGTEAAGERRLDAAAAEAAVAGGRDVLVRLTDAGLRALDASRTEKLHADAELERTIRRQRGF
jgi:hypothetical protein